MPNKVNNCKRHFLTVSVDLLLQGKAKGNL